MTNEPSPRPWRLEGKCIYTANGDFIGEMEHTDDARIVVDAVNWYCDWGALSSELERLRAERDRLRDIVRRLARVAQDTLDFAEAMSGIIPDHPERAKARSEIEALLREARAAIGEDEP